MKRTTSIFIIVTSLLAMACNSHGQTKSILILPLQAPPDSGNYKLQRTIGTQFSHALALQLQNFPDVRIVDRSEIERVAQEMEYDINNLTASQGIELGQRLSAKYIVPGEINWLRVDKESSGRKKVFQGALRTTIRIVDKDTTTSHAFKPFEVKLDRLNMERRGGTRDPIELQYPSFSEELISANAMGQAQAIALHLRPLSIVKTESGDLVLNHGRAALHKNQQWTASRTGKLRNENLGVLKITEVGEENSLAQISIDNGLGELVRTGGFYGLEFTIYKAGSSSIPSGKSISTMAKPRWWSR